MKIKEIEISNFRSVSNVKIKFKDLMMFIGQNNHGKSNILYAILFFFGEIKVQDLDFFNGTDVLYVEIKFEDLDDADKVTFSKYLTASKEILVRKTAFMNGSFEYNGYIQNPHEDYLKEVNIRQYTKREDVQKLPIYEYLPKTGRILNDSVKNAQQQYIKKHLEEIVFSYELEKTNFLGAKNIAQGIFGDIFFIPAVKNINEDLSSNKISVFSKLYSKVIELIIASDNNITSIKNKINEQFKKFQKYNEDETKNKDRPNELNEFEERLSKNLGDWGVNLEVEILPPDVDDVFKSDVNIWIDDGIKTDINRKGHGLQRAMTFSLIKTLSEHIAIIPGEERPNRQASKSSYFIFEEPELYLHPQAQRALLDSLITLAKNSQVILCTHSSSLISLSNYKSISIVRKNNETKETKITQYQKELFMGNEKQNFNLLSWINPDRAELFFAKKVILLEGQTDKTIIPYLAKKIGVFKHEFTVIDCGSKNNIHFYINLLSKFKIPYIAVYDKDHQEGKSNEDIVASDKASDKIEKMIDTLIGKSVIFDNDIEEELGMQSGTSSKPYKALKEVSKEAFVLKSTLEDKIKIIYE
jgi:CRISPR-associated exonuclease Cas4